MNKWIKKELFKCSVAELPSFDENTTNIHIPKHQGIVIKKDKCYLIQIKKDKIEPSITINYNQGSIPPYDYYKIDVNQVIGPMVNLNGVAYDYENKKDICSVWSGWLSTQSIIILEEI